MNALSKQNAVQVRNAREGRRLVSDGYYARTISAAIRCASKGQQAALVRVIVEDGTEHLFRAVNGTLVAA